MYACACVYYFHSGSLQGLDAMITLRGRERTVEYDDDALWGEKHAHLLLRTPHSSLIQWAQAVLKAFRQFLAPSRPDSGPETRRVAPSNACLVSFLSSNYRCFD